MSNKNTMLPTFEATYANMIKGLEPGGLITSPCWVYVTDRECLAFVHYEKVNGVKKLVPHIMLWDKVAEMEKQLEGLNDPETGEPVNVVTYVTENVTPIQNDITEIKNNGATIMITTDGGDS